MGSLLKQETTSLIHINHNKPFTDSLVIAECVGLTHKRVIRLIRNHQADLEEFGRVGFENSTFMTKGGIQQREIVDLSEDQATFLMMLFKPSPIVVKFRVQLVKAFRKALNDLERLSKQTNEPAWVFVRDETKVGFKWMADSIKDQRARQGKETKSVHYMNEAKLINSVMAGVFSGINRNTLPSQDLATMADLQRYNARLIAQDVPYADRKAMLVSYLRPKLEKVA